MLPVAAIEVVIRRFRREIVVALAMLMLTRKPRRSQVESSSNEFAKEASSCRQTSKRYSANSLNQMFHKIFIELSFVERGWR